MSKSPAGILAVSFYFYVLLFFGVITYGEGNSVGQSVPIVNNIAFNNIWYWASEYALEQVTNRKFNIEGRDWTGNGR